MGKKKGGGNALVPVGKKESLYGQFLVEVEVAGEGMEKVYRR